jgi:hypothetical protein
MSGARYIILLVLLALLMPTPAHAQTADPPSDVADLALVGPVSLQLTWTCAGCGGTPTFAPLPTTSAEQVRSEHWWDIGVHISWLVVQLWNQITYPIICWLLVLVQALLNSYSQVVNTVFVPAINSFWQLFMYFVLLYQRTYIGLWGLLESLRLIVWQSYGVLVQIEREIAALLDLVQTLLNLAADLMLDYARLSLLLISAFQYVLTLWMSTMIAFLSVVTDLETHAPAQVTGLHNNFFFAWFVGILRGIQDSSLGWWYSAQIALYYASWMKRIHREGGL